MLKRSRNIGLAFLLVALVSGCVHLTPAQQTLWALNVYDAQYNEYLDMTINPSLDAETKAYLRANPADIKGDYINPGLTDEAKKMLRVKKELLIQLKPIVLMAADYHKSGKLPPADVQKTLTDLINRLLTEGGK